MPQGTIRKLVMDKGFGFIQREDGPDVFVHHSDIVSSGFRSLKEGDAVEFEVTEGSKGLKAANVSVR